MSDLPSKEMNLSRAGLFTYTELLELLNYEWSEGYRVSKLWLTKSQVVNLQRELMAMPTPLDKRPKLVAHMYPPNLIINIKTLNTEFGDVDVEIEP